MVILNGDSTVAAGAAEAPERRAAAMARRLKNLETMFSFSKKQWIKLLIRLMEEMRVGVWIFYPFSLGNFSRIYIEDLLFLRWIYSPAKIFRGHLVIPGSEYIPQTTPYSRVESRTPGPAKTQSDLEYVRKLTCISM